jgi:hypothetical protein
MKELHTLSVLFLEKVFQRLYIRKYVVIPLATGALPRITTPGTANIPPPPLPPMFPSPLLLHSHGFASLAPCKNKKVYGVFA